jgi:HEAT repeat protein
VVRKYKVGTACPLFCLALLAADAPPSDRGIATKSPAQQTLDADLQTLRQPPQPDSNETSLEQVIAQTNVLREAACRRIGLAGERTALPFLLEYTQYFETLPRTEKLPQDRGGTESEILFEERLVSREVGWPVRKTACEALGAIGDPLAAQALLQVVRTPVPPPHNRDPLAALHQREVQISALEALARLRVPYTVPSLIELLDKNDCLVGRHAGEALRNITNHDPAPDGSAPSEELQTQWRSWWEGHRHQNLETWWIEGFERAGSLPPGGIVTLDDPRAVTHLLSSLPDAPEWLARNIEEVINRASGPSLPAALAELLESTEHPQVKRTAARLFLKATGLEPPFWAEQALSGSDPLLLRNLVTHCLERWKAQSPPSPKG